MATGTGIANKRARKGTTWTMTSVANVYRVYIIHNSGCYIAANVSTDQDSVEVWAAAARRSQRNALNDGGRGEGATLDVKQGTDTSFSFDINRHSFALNTYLLLGFVSTIIADVIKLTLTTAARHIAPHSHTHTHRIPIKSANNGKKCLQMVKGRVDELHFNMLIDFFFIMIA